MLSDEEVGERGEAAVAHAIESRLRLRTPMSLSYVARTSYGISASSSKFGSRTLTRKRPLQSIIAIPKRTRLCSAS